MRKTTTRLLCALACALALAACGGGGSDNQNNNSTDTTPPTIPANFQATAANPTQVDLRWDASTDTGTGVTGYRIRRQDMAGVLATVNALTYQDNSVSANTTYTYTVTAIDGANPPNESAATPGAMVTTPAINDTTAPNTPTNLVANAVAPTRVDLSWTASTDGGGSGLAGYHVFRDGARIGPVVASTTYSDTTASASTTYSYRVRAVDGAGNVSPLSGNADATTPATSMAGLDSRPSNTTCLAPAQPSSNASVDIQSVFTNLSFEEPVLMVQRPGDNSRWYVVEQTGAIRYFDTPNPASATLWANLQGIVDDTAQEMGLLGFAFHPNFAANGRVFVSYTGNAGPTGIRSFISEFHVDTTTGVFDDTSERVLLTLDQPFDNHNGGNIAFGPDGNLYVGFGDGGSGGDPGNRSQNRNLLFGKILRINVNGAQPYTIPADNPYAGNALCSDGNGTSPCPEIYAYGLRNPWRWSFDKNATEPDLWVADVGQDSWEEVDRVVRGGNYGWRIREGMHCYNAASCASSNNGDPLIDPVAEYDHGVGNSITGGYVYRGSAIQSLIGRYVFADFGSGRLMYLAPNASGGFDRRDLMDTGLTISSFAQGTDGELYVLNYFGHDIYKLVPGTGTIVDTIPADLAGTGCVNPADPTQPASGLIPYAPNAPFWSDGAVKERWMAVPDNQKITVQADGDWSFPDGTVLVKNFRLGTRLVETRLFMRHPDTHNWGGYTYQWNAAQTAATLVKGGLVTNVNPPGQDWIYPSEAQCLQCHTAAAGRSLGLETAQLNGDLTYPTTGRNANQLATLDAIGMFTAPIGAPATLPSYPDPFGNAPLDQRARSYLHTNCSQCHRVGGPTPVNMDLRFSTAIGATATCNVAPNSGDLGVPNAHRITPGNAAQSLIWVRMSQRGAHQMPPLGTNQVDTAGAALIQAWINGLNASCQ